MAKCTKCGKRSLLLRVDSDGYCADCATQVRHDLEAEVQALQTQQSELTRAAQKREDELLQNVSELEQMLTPEMREIRRLEERLRTLESRDETLQRAIDAKIKQSTTLAQRIVDQNAQIIANSDLLELEEFAVYKPRFAFSTTEEYKKALDDTRAAEKALIKAKTAATGAVEWKVNGDARKGRKMVEDMKKLCLRAFNNECDAAVAGVKFNNYDRQEMRIEKAYDQIAKLGDMMSVRISPAYKALKIKELQIALEYAMKKQEEKEELREARARQREEAKLAKEIEAARKAAYKEQAHYQIAFEHIQKQLAECPDEESRTALQAKHDEIAEHLSEIETNLKDIDYREANQRAGYVYVISNIGSFGEGVYKIGMTRRLEPMERVYELSDASVPFNFDTHAMIFSNDAPALEAALHRAFDDRKVNAVNHRREFFRVPLSEIKAVVRANHDKTVEFVDVPDAEQYRETLKLQSTKEVSD